MTRYRIKKRYIAIEFCCPWLRLGGAYDAYAALAAQSGKVRMGATAPALAASTASVPNTCPDATKKRNQSRWTIT